MKWHVGIQMDDADYLRREAGLMQQSGTLAGQLDWIVGMIREVRSGKWHDACPDHRTEECFDTLLTHMLWVLAPRLGPIHTKLELRVGPAVSACRTTAVGEFFTTGHGRVTCAACRGISNVLSGLLDL